MFLLQSFCIRAFTVVRLTYQQYCNLITTTNREDTAENNVSQTCYNYVHNIFEDDLYIQSVLCVIFSGICFICISTPVKIGSRFTLPSFAVILLTSGWFDRLLIHDISNPTTIY